MTNEITAFQWEEPIRGSFGPGISRPKVAGRARKFTVVVRQQCARPMKVTLLAENKTLALRYAKNRWPGAAVQAA